MKKNWIIPAALASLGFFLLFGLVTVLIPNTFFARMTPVTILDYVFLTVTSLLMGSFVGLQKVKQANSACKVTAYSGGIGGFLGFGCTLCNKVLMLLLGAGGVLAYVEPYRPIIGSLGITLMSAAVYKSWKS